MATQMFAFIRAINTGGRRLTNEAPLAPSVARASWLSGEAYRARLETEVEVVRRLAENGNPVAGLEPRVEPRVFWRDGFAITMWSHFESVQRTLPLAASSTPSERARPGRRSTPCSRRTSATVDDRRPSTVD